MTPSESSLIADVYARLRKDVASPYEVVVNWFTAEWRVAVSFIVDFNSGPLSGISLERLLKPRSRS
jgi:hypothetical protein